MIDQKPRPNQTLETYFAPAARASQAELKQDIARLSQNPVMDAVLSVAGGLLLVLNQQRQILAINETLLQRLGIPDSKLVLGLRPGEVLSCSHAHDHTGGCGTGPACATCGAAIAILACQHTHQTTQRDCFLTVEQDGQPVDFYFQVRCQPIDLGEQTYLLLFMRDITVEQQKAAVERVFFHDFNNILQGLMLHSQLLEMLDQPDRMRQTARKIIHITELMAKEVALQKALSNCGSLQYPLAVGGAPVAELVKEVAGLVRNHPAAVGKSLELGHIPLETEIVTDRQLLQRVLLNMLVNAFEASLPGGQVRLWVEPQADSIALHVWSRPAIPDEVAVRIFQRNFSTKKGSGRGLGTYAMKLFGETYLKGKVSFTTSDTDGTVFTIALPHPPAAEPATD